ncbi:DNA/RNA non-specific endonuclease [Streptomyces sp. NPDC004609]|uniref:DNA/RNA non-specific endonuclease n=1 Tax=Streptomyces sp. NPDC004609 TaxID=3364704 RepID=UPI0036C7F9DC
MAPTRPAPRPQVDVARIQQSAIDQAIFYSTQVLAEMTTGSTDPFAPVDATGVEDIQELFPELDIDVDAGFGGTGADHSAKRTRSTCSRDLPSTDSAFYYAPMTRFGPGVNECRATGAVAWIDASDLRPWRLDPKWKPEGFHRLPVNNRAALHLIGNQMGGAHDTLSNFVAGYQKPADSPHMRTLENDVTNDVRSGQRVTLGVVPVYGGVDPAIPTEVKMYAVGDGGYSLNCTVYNRSTGGFSCSERTSGGDLSVP